MDEIGARVAFSPDSKVVAASSRRDGLIALGQRRFDRLDLERARAHRPRKSRHSPGSPDKEGTPVVNR
jgi:hypothetical protein